MRFLHVVELCCFLAAVFVKASTVLEVSGYVGGDVSIHCSGGWTSNHSSQHNGLYFCKGFCSRKNILVQSERGAPVTRGRYRLEVNREQGAFYVIIRRLTRADAGTYSCGGEETFTALYQDISLTVLNASSVPAAPSTTISRRSLSGTEPPASASPAAEETKQRAAASLTATTVVIIVSVSLALLVCAVIPLIFYGHWRSNARGELSQCHRPARRCTRSDTWSKMKKNLFVSVGRNREGGNKCESAVGLQSFEPAADPDSGAQDVRHYAAAYQALDPKTLD
ncbi:uncharacterized protein LOC114851951 isoform X2 [Betta splendens]|uniref:Uncharacterized protein LOC114851951 isoform X2 n=1 Tax=Betta splendens TaxID=158456 RepID=A0A6P7LY43_BETSP|nr:uncharacterized protein LOC114851951 isoform X2 [Betta splendens]